MNDEVIKKLITEIKEEFQIPPFFSDKALENYLNEGNAVLLNLVDDLDYKNDLVARSILKNYVNYAFFKRIPDFFENYKSNILSWQMSKLKVINDDTNI